MLISKFLNKNMQESIVVFEKKYKIILPYEYKSFLLKYNGGYTPKTKFKVNNISSDIVAFYGLGDVKLSLDNINVNRWLNIGLLPIAFDSFGNYIVISVSDNNYGEILFYDHEKVGYVDCLSNNLLTFFACCKSDVINEASKKTIEEREAALIERGRGNIITDELRKMWQEEIDKYANIKQEEVVLD